MFFFSFFRLTDYSSLSFDKKDTFGPEHVSYSSNLINTYHNVGFHSKYFASQKLTFLRFDLVQRSNIYGLFIAGRPDDCRFKHFPIKIYFVNEVVLYNFISF